MADAARDVADGGEAGKPQLGTEPAVRIAQEGERPTVWWRRRRSSGTARVSEVGQPELILTPTTLIRSVWAMHVPGQDASFVPILADFLASRLRDAPEGSYSHAVMTDSVLARRKVMEEAFEVCLELGSAEIVPERLAEEAADLVFHLLCGLTGAGVEWSQVEEVLMARHRKDAQ